MDRSKLLEILNKRLFDINVFIEYAKEFEINLSDEMINFILTGVESPYSRYIVSSYENCLKYFEAKLEINHIKDLETGQIIKYY